MPAPTNIGPIFFLQGPVLCVHITSHPPKAKSSTSTKATAAMSSASPSTSMPRLFNHHAYWCHECDMSIGLPPSPTPNALLCPHCHRDALEQMDSFAPSPTTEHPFHSTLTAPDDNFLLTSPYLHRLIHLATTPTPPTSNPHSNPAPKYAIDSLQEVTITQQLLDDDPHMLCPVCKDPFRLNTSMKLMPCQHNYHADCIVPWLEINNSCPVCRYRLPTNEDNYSEGLNRGERYVGFVRLEELVDDGEDFFGFRNTLRHIARRYSRDADVLMEDHIVSEENLFSPTQIGEVERGEGVLQRENSVETLSSWPRGQVEEGSGGGGGGRNDDVQL